MSCIFETVMLVCFGLSWPINVIKAYKARTAKATSLPFILLIFVGYIAGISAKVISGQMNYVFIDEVQNVQMFQKAVDGLYINKNEDVLLI